MRRVCILMVAALSVLCAWAGESPQDFSGQKNRPRQVPSSIPVDVAVLEQRPALASVPVDPPSSTDTSRWKFTPAFFSKNGPGVSAENLRVAAATSRMVKKYAPAPILAGSGLIRPARREVQPVSGQTRKLTAVAANNFVNSDGTTFYPGGTSWFNIMQLEKHSEDSIVQMLNIHYQNGVRVLRTFGHNDGRGTTMPVQIPIQPSPGVFNEAALQRYDFAMDALAKAGIRIIITLTNYWPEYGGMQWYVDEIVGQGQPKELFFTDPRVIAAYETWVRKLTMRRNTVNGRLYSEDPTVFAWELCNECHTTDNYERNRGLVPGSLLYNWLVREAAFLKRGVGVKQMVANGNEGYRAQGLYDPDAPVTYPFNNWINDGSKGEDFVRNLGIADLEFAVIHLYPSNWGIPASEHTWVNDNYIGPRAALAAAAGKPLILEEYGMPRGYMPSRETLFNSEVAAAKKHDLAGTMVWEVWAVFGDDSNYDFSYTQDGGVSTLRMLDYQVLRTFCSKPCRKPAAVPPFPTKPIKPGKAPVAPSNAVRLVRQRAYFKAASVFNARKKARIVTLGRYNAIRTIRRPTKRQLLPLKWYIRMQQAAINASKRAYVAALNAQKAAGVVYLKTLAAYKFAHAKYVGAMGAYQKAVKQYGIQVKKYNAAWNVYAKAATAYQRAKNALTTYTACYAKCLSPTSTWRPSPPPPTRSPPPPPTSSPPPLT